MGELGKAMGPAIERVGRPCFPPAVQCLGDKKKPVRHPVAHQEQLDQAFQHEVACHAK